MKFEEVSEHLEFNRKILFTKERFGFSENLRSLTEDQKKHLRKELNEFYVRRGWGLKLVARNVLGVTYTNCRTTFKFLGIEFIKGFDKCTDFMKEFRKQKALKESEDKTGWASLSLPRQSENTRRGVQGYYFNKSKNKYVWLRSSWEYIYAKFLDKINAKWDVEVEVYKLSDNTSYRPDFYIYDEHWNLEKIVEIKGYFDCRAYKIDLLRSEYFNNSPVELILILDIKKYIAEGSNIGKEWKTWKLIKKSKDSLLVK